MRRYSKAIAAALAAEATAVAAGAFVSFQAFAVGTLGALVVFFTTYSAPPNEG